MLQIAKVLKSNGTDGDILIGLFDITIEEIDIKEPVYINFDGLPVPFFIESIAQKGNSKAIVHITDVDNLEDAEEIVGRAVYADYFEEEEDEGDLTGWTVLLRGTKVGEVSGHEDIPGNPCIYIRKEDGSEALVPLHEDFIIKVNEKKQEINLDLPEGLL